jgi:hypothetical protein
MSYAGFCQDQAFDCARRARLARSPDIAAYYQDLGWRWLRLAEQAQKTGGALGNAHWEAEALNPLRLHSSKPAMVKAQVARADGSLFRLRFREKWAMPHFKKIAKDPALLFDFCLWRAQLTASVGSTGALRE